MVDVSDEPEAVAAKLILEADFCLLSIGAGMSADSGLPVFKDIADNEAYKQLGLSYHQICQPSWYTEDPPLFYGFWGKCHNDYRGVQPHEGYFIVKSWQNRYFGETSAQTDSLRKAFEEAPKWHDFAPSEIPGPFFVFTSNIDSHSEMPGLFEPREIYEIHGSALKWQCFNVCGSDVWKLPPNHTFNVDLATMRCEETPEGETIEHNNNNETIAQSNVYPTCPSCGSRARPWVLMFIDMGWQRIENHSTAFLAWQHVVEDKLRSDHRRKLVIIEIGCGKTVPTLRNKSEKLIEELPDGSVHLIRINPDFPGPDSLKETVRRRVVSVRSTALAGITKIEKYLTLLDPAKHSIVEPPEGGK